MASGAPYSVHLDPDVAHELASKGAALLLLDVPPGTHIGIDHQASARPPRPIPERPGGLASTAGRLS